MKSYNDLKTTLGKYDSLVEFLELCIRNLKENAISDADVETKIINALNKSNINFNANEYKTVKPLIYKNFIAIAYSAFDEFIFDFSKELDIFYGKYKKQKKTEETKLDFLLERMETQITKFAIGNIKNSNEYSILEYYRLIRNTFVHASSKKDTKLQSLHNSVKKLKLDEKYIKYKNLPNSENEIDFNDFIFVSKITLDLAFIISKHLDPKIDDYVKFIDESNFIRYGINSDRFLNSIASFLVTEYRLPFNVALSIAQLKKEKIETKMTLESDR
ncbi:hypothetical protein AB3N60_10910 [Leptospira sp. WS39.C2]